MHIFTKAVIINWINLIIVPFIIGSLIKIINPDNIRAVYDKWFTVYTVFILVTLWVVIVRYSIWIDDGKMKNKEFWFVKISMWLQILIGIIMIPIAFLSIYTYKNPGSL